LANGSLTRLFWRLLDVLDYWLTQAQLWLADAVCDPRNLPDSADSVDVQLLGYIVNEPGLAVGAPFPFNPLL
jgi:hypothetical protein